MELKTIRIIFESEDGERIIQGTARDVLNAEGELQRLARAWQRMLISDGDRLEDDNESSRSVDAVIGVGDERIKTI